MLTIRKILVLSLVLLLPLSAGAQKKRKAKRKPVVELPQEDPRITSMREMTQQVIFIDSIVTDKDSFLKQIHLSAETGSIMTYHDFFGKGADSTYVFLNEMDNKAYFSLPDDSLHQQLFTIDKLGKEWSRSQPLKGLSEGIAEAAYPFMMTDGITFYFAGRGEESIGGYDIFLTRYDSHSGNFFKPENIGMPFNSEANDYMYAIDEYNRIGYFVSDRRQPEGKVCVYVFIPSESRQTYDMNTYTEKQLRGLADITRIADTWGNGSERNAALKRRKGISMLKATKSQNLEEQTKKWSSKLVINDAITYSSENDFRSPEAAGYYLQLIDARQMITELQDQLEKMRIIYQNADNVGQRSIGKDILQAEADELDLYHRIKRFELQARHAENEVITTKK